MVSSKTIMCPHCKKFIRVPRIKDKMIQLLKVPRTVTELFLALKVSSMGTVAYHLKRMEAQGLLLKKKDSREQGCPTHYWLKDKEARDKVPR